MNTTFVDPFPFLTCWKDITNSQLWRPLQALFWSSKSACHLSSYIGGESNNAYDWQFWVICLLKKIVHGFGWCHILTPNQSQLPKLYLYNSICAIFDPRKWRANCQTKKSEASPQVPTKSTTGWKGGIVLGTFERKTSERCKIVTWALTSRGLMVSTKNPSEVLSPKLPPQEEWVNKALAKEIWWLALGS